MKVREHDVSGDDDAVFALTLKQLREESESNSELGLIIKSGKKPFLAIYAGDLFVIANVMAALEKAGMIDADKIMDLLDGPPTVRA